LRAQLIIIGSLKKQDIMNTLTISAQHRESTGKSSSRKVREQGHIPAVIYGGDQPIHIYLEPMAVRPLVYSPNFQIAELTIGPDSLRCILKDVQYHPVTDEVQHIDFLQLSPGKKVKVELPVRFKGDSPGVRLGGKLIQKMRRAKVLTTPEHLVDQLLVDISKLEMGQSIRVRDIEARDGIEIMNAPAIPVATINIPRSMRSAATAEKKATAKGENA
jgi:large subunit ribosomal protein L25